MPQHLPPPPASGLSLLQRSALSRIAFSLALLAVLWLLIGWAVTLP